jgi:hypothetical protein
MALSIRDAELFGVTESSATLCFRVEEGGAAVDARVEIRLDGEPRERSEGPAGTRVVRLEGLEPGRRYALELRGEGGLRAEPDRYLPAAFETHPAPRSEPAATFATLNDLHFGEPRVGGTLLESGDYGPEAPGFPAVHADEGEVPYWSFMNEDAVAEINAAGVDATFVKGDIADRGLPEQFAAAADCFSKLATPLHAFLGNHDHYALEQGLEVDGYALLGQPRAPRQVDLGGWRLLLIETAVPGEHHGELCAERLAWLESALEETREEAIPTLVLAHHQPVPPRYRDRYPNTIGIDPGDSLRLFACLARHPQVRGVLLGHTHRNVVRRDAMAADVPFIEVNCTKDYPGGWAHYRLFEDGHFRQEVRRTASRRALDHSSRCRHLFRGLYRDFALGSLEARSYVGEPLPE